VQLDAADFLSELDESDVLIAVPRSGIGVLRRLMRYAERNINWTMDIIDDVYYNSPSAADWEAIRRGLARLEYGLMSVVTIESLVSAIESLCACSATSTGRSDVIQVVAPGAPDTAQETAIHDTALPADDALRCSYANSAFGLFFELWTENVLPAVDAASDALALAIVATTAFAVLTGGLGIPVAIGADLFVALVHFLIDGAATNLTNWLWGNAQELVCVIYRGLAAGWVDAAAGVRGFVNAESSLSRGDKEFVTVLLGNSWFIQAVAWLVDQGWVDPADYANYPCADCGGTMPPGCYRMDAPEWVIDGNYAHLNGAGNLVLGDSTLGGRGAYRVISPGVDVSSFHVMIAYKPPWNQLPPYAACSVSVIVYDGNDHHTKGEKFLDCYGSTKTWHTESGYLDISADAGDIVWLCVNSAGGTSTVVQFACATW